MLHTIGVHFLSVREILKIVRDNLLSVCGMGATVRFTWNYCGWPGSFLRDRLEEAKFEGKNESTKVG